MEHFEFPSGYLAPRDRSSADRAGKEALGESAARKYLSWISAAGERAELSKRASERAARQARWSLASQRSAARELQAFQILLVSVKVIFQS